MSTEYVRDPRESVRVWRSGGEEPSDGTVSDLPEGRRSPPGWLVSDMTPKNTAELYAMEMWSIDEQAFHERHLMSIKNGAFCRDPPVPSRTYGICVRDGYGRLFTVSVEVRRTVETVIRSISHTP